ncbi:response regulator transcription factor [Streptomyces sp. NBC_00390]|uniref:response regulator transcription factor n=1 Tax=unclassified Streptomyces TaxID=2593676 RepID=UPI002E1F6090
MLRVLVVDDNPVVRAGLTAVLQVRDDCEVVAQALDGRQAYDAAVRHRPDVILLDVRMPGVDGLSALPHLVQLAPVLMMTYSSERETVQEALRLGAGGYLVHGEFTVDQLLTAVRDMRHGRVHFTHSASTALAAKPRQFAEQSSLVQAGVAHSSGGPSVAGGLHRVICELSRREVEVMDLIASGMTNQQIADSCFISQKTVKNHINRIFAKLHASSRGEAIAIWNTVARMRAVRGA